MANHKSLIVGAGVLGQRLHDYLHELSHDVITISKSEKEWSTKHYCIDLLNENCKLPQLPELDYLFIVLTPSVRDVDGYRDIYLTAVDNLMKQFPPSNNVHCVFISSISVYGQMQTGTIDEGVTPIPDNFRGEILLEAEVALKSHCQSLSIVRAAGLYSNKREKLLHSLLDKNKATISKYLNLIHDDDLCQWIWQAAKSKWTLSIAADGAPFQRRDLHSAQQYPATSYPRLFSSQFLSKIQLKHPSFRDWMSKR